MSAVSAITFAPTEPCFAGGAHAQLARDSLPFVVYCRKHDGTLREWNRYSSRIEAEHIARALNRAGCEAVFDSAGTPQ